MKIYTMEFPVRLTHWLNVLSILVLSITGFYIGNPFIHSINENYIMGWMRFIHFVAAYIFTMAISLRLYWLFVGNKYANWKVFIPVTLKQWKKIYKELKFHLFISKKYIMEIGHTPLAGLVYMFVFLIFIFQVFSGFALYSLNHHGLPWNILGWMNSIMHIQIIRLYHHLVMYVIIIFAIVHIYTAWTLELEEKGGLMSSIFSGYRFINKKK